MSLYSLLLFLHVSGAICLCIGMGIWLVLAADSDQNYGHWKNDQFTKLIDQADKAQDPNTRIQYYQEAERVAAQDVGDIFVYWYGNFDLVKPWVKGLTYTAQDPTIGAYSYKDAEILKH